MSEFLRQLLTSEWSADERAKLEAAIAAVEAAVADRRPIGVTSGPSGFSMVFGDRTQMVLWKESTPGVATPPSTAVTRGAGGAYNSQGASLAITGSN